MKRYVDKMIERHIIASGGSMPQVIIMSRYSWNELLEEITDHGVLLPDKHIKGNDGELTYKGYSVYRSEDVIPGEVKIY